jgi:glycopeptide antibiotics resistance protein
MQVPITGTYSASTVGWHQASETAFASLAAPTIVSLITILIVVFTLVTKGRAKEPDANHYFNPCDVLHIISAASAGGMQKNFPPFHENNVEHCENTMITLAPVEGDNGRSGFIDLN